ncbi:MULTISPECIES: hypothetical protein [Micromonospora]|uniref:hypothetical protein n=1 Tax=Micromonospora TaxID=1873 RepID=UPI001EF8DFC1|nr:MULTISPECIES: hypothetical protein [Micromonospora]
MSPSPPHRTPHRRPFPAVLVAVLALAGCGAPPELHQAATPVVTASTAPPPVPTPTPSAPPAAPTAPVSSPSDLVATACADGPTGDRVVSLLRGKAGVLPRGVRVTVRSGPLCGGGWQYTVLKVSGHEELQVVTRGRPGALELVTAGTDVCSVEVRAAGPPGIRTLACDGTPGA